MKELWLGCGNALKRATAISTTIASVFANTLNGLWQCPQAGNRHFYLAFKNDISKIIECGNALKRATAISTVPLKKPSIYAGSGTRFCTLFTEYSENKLLGLVFLSFPKKVIMHKNTMAVLVFIFSTIIEEDLI